MKYMLCTLLPTLLLLTACAGDRFTVTMTDNDHPAAPVQVTVELPANPRDGLTFVIDDVPYYVASSPTVSDPVFVLDTPEDDGMTSVTLQLGNVMYSDDICLVDLCRLHMLPEEGVELVYENMLDAWQPLLDWLGNN